MRMGRGCLSALGRAALRACACTHVAENAHIYLKKLSICKETHVSHKNSRTAPVPYSFWDINKTGTCFLKIVQITRWLIILAVD